MHRITGLILMYLLFSPGPVIGADLSHLADCSARVFGEIGRTKAWSGKPPEGCFAKVSVSKGVNGAQVTAWIIDRDGEQWEMTSLTVQMGYRELANAQVLAKGNRDIASRSERLGACLDSIVKFNDPLDCRYKATKEYHAGEKMGIERHWNIWLDDDGRKSAVEYIVGDTELIPYPPVDLPPGESLPPGTDLHLHIR